MENYKYICDLIIEKDSQIYFDNDKHFEKFLKSPKNIKYHTKERTIYFFI